MWEAIGSSLLANPIGLGIVILGLYLVIVVVRKLPRSK